jgi:hypothetical protein
MKLMDEEAIRIVLDTVLEDARHNLSTDGEVLPVIILFDPEHGAVAAPQPNLHASFAPQLMAVLGEIIPDIEAVALVNETWMAKGKVGDGDNRRPSEREDREEAIVVELKQADGTQWLATQMFTRPSPGEILYAEPSIVSDKNGDKLESRRLCKLFA